MVSLKAVSVTRLSRGRHCEQARQNLFPADRHATLELRKSETLPTTLDQAKAYKSKRQHSSLPSGTSTTAAAEGGQPANDQQASGEAGKVLLQQLAPKVTIEQAPPQVTFSQGQPQIMIHQPAPTITVDIPQAEVVVRIPTPQVAVQQSKPQVDVQQSKPEVAVNEGNAATVQLERSGRPAVQYQSDENGGEGGHSSCRD